MTTLRLDILLLAFRPETPDIERLLASLGEQAQSPFVSELWVIDNSCDPRVLERLRQTLESRSPVGPVHLHVAERNLGFGTGVNRLLRECNAAYVLVINQDAWLDANALAILGSRVHTDANVAAWELRQVP